MYTYSKSKKFLAAMVFMAAAVPTIVTATTSTGSAPFVMAVDPASTNIHDDGRGAYIDGVDGAAVYQDQAFHAHVDKFRVQSPRYLVFYLNNPVIGSGASNLGAITSGNEIYVEQAGLIAVGQTVLARAKFVLSINKPYDHQLWFGMNAGDGSNQVVVTRVSTTAWTISAPAGSAIARLYSVSPSGTLTSQGFYNVPFLLNTNPK